MVQELILVRHGKAEERNANLPDEERKLTKKGERELKAMFSVLGPYLAGRKKVKIWSSSLERAFQTAAMLSREMGRAKVIFRESVADGDFESLTKQISREGGSRLLVVVGHEPYLSEWTEKITGVRLDFRKGAAVSIKLDSVKPLKGEIKWQLNPEYYIDGVVMPLLTFQAEDGDKPKVNGKGSLEKEMDRLFLSCLKEIVEAHNEFMIAPDDPESVHRLRVKIRQFRSVLSFAKPEVGKKDYENIQNRTRELAGEFTYLRQVDVMAGKIKEGYPALLSILRSERENEKKTVYSKIASGTAAPLFFDLLQWIERDPFKKSKNGKKPLGDFAGDRAERWLGSFREGLQSMDSKDAKEIHALRIQGKKLRYMATLMEPVLEGKQAALIPGLKELQDRLGLICDIQMDIPVLEKLKDKYGSPEAASEIDKAIELKKREVGELIRGMPREIK
ncbi:MAG: phosphohistidine phosphatase SixA [Firmicutes bacterium]|nr:phosphohistidine phosphatase SixA [Bacillota bacterium]